MAGLSDSWKEYTTDLGAEACKYKHNQEIHAGDTIGLDVRGRNIPAGAKVWVDDITLEPVVRELVIFPTYPNYRGMLWEDQGTIIQWKTVVDPPEGYAAADLTVTVDVVRESDGAVLDAVDAPELPPVAGEGPWIGYSVTDMSYEAGDLPDDVYLLRGHLRRKSDNRTLYTYPDYRIVKEPPSAQRDNWKVWVDKHNRVVLNGKPTFLWGTYARFTAARNVFPQAAKGSKTDPNTYRSYANGCNSSRIGEVCTENIPAFTPWNRNYGLEGSTFLKQVADLKMNAITVHADMGTFNIGFDSPANGAGFRAAGQFVTSGAALSGSGTDFGNEVLVGDTARITRPGAGKITNQGLVVTGVDTRFLSEVAPGDLITVTPGGARFVQQVHSNTSLTLTGTAGFTWSNASFTVTQFRRLKAIDGQTAVLDEPFLPDVTQPATLSYEKCAPGRYNPSRDELGAFIEALRDYGIWYWHLTSNIHGLNTVYWSYAGYLSRCHLVNRADSAEFFTSFKPLGQTDGFLGFYTSDEPPYAESRRGIENTWQIQQGQQRSGMGGLNFWVDGAIPSHAFDQWNTITDVISPDPYPATGDNLPTFDDFAYRLSTWAKHGRSYFWPRRSASAVFDRRPMIPAIQLFAWFASQGFLTSSYPQVSDMKIQMIASVAAGASGIMWWHMGSGSQTLGDRMEEDYLRFRRAAGVIPDLLPILDEPIQDLAGRQDGKPGYGILIDSVSDPDIKCSSRKLGSQVLLACTNTTNVDKTVTITLKDAIAGSVKLPWDGSVLSPSGASFTAVFRGVNGGTQKPGAGAISASGQTVTCSSSCNFTKELAARHTVTANGRTRLVLSVESDTQFTIDSSVGAVWNGHDFTYSSDSDKENAAHFFLIDIASPGE